MKLCNTGALSSLIILNVIICTLLTLYTAHIPEHIHINTVIVTLKILPSLTATVIVVLQSIVCVYLHENRSDCVVNVSISSSAQKFPETHLGLLCWRLTVHTQFNHQDLININIK